MKKFIIIPAIVAGLVGASVSPLLTSAVTASANTLGNPSFETAWTADANTALNWSNYQSGFKRSNEAARTGSYSAKAQNTSTSQTSGVFQRVDLNQTSIQPVFIGGYVKGSNISAATNSYFGATIYAEIHLKSGKTVYWNTAKNTGTFDWRWIGFNTLSLPAVNEPISYIYIVGILGQSSGTAYFDDFTVQTVNAAPSAAATIMFDDGELTDFTVAKPALDQYGFKASTAIITGQVGVNPETMTWSQIKSLSQSGWEIMSHTVSHSDMTTLSSANLTAELQNSKSALAAQGLTATNIALPLGAYNGAVLEAASKYYSSVRPFETGYNPAGSFPLNVKVFPIYSNTTVAEVQNAVAYAQQNKLWVVFVFHKLSTSGDDNYYLNPTVFKNMVAAIAKSGISVVTYDTGIKAFSISGSGTIPTNPTPSPTPTTSPTPTPTPSPTTGSISGTLWNDSDSDGVFDSSEVGTGVRTVFLDTNRNGKLDSGEKQVSSDTKGYYKFSNLNAGTYYVSRVFPNGYRFSNSNTPYITVSVTAGKNVTGVNIGTTNK